MMIAGIVSICCIICLLNAVTGIADAVKNGGAVPYVTVLMTAVTAICTVMIWKGVRNMED